MTLCDPDELARLARAGDVAALDGLTRCFADRLLAVGRRRCRSEAEAEDAVQDALLAATEHLGDYRGEGRIDAWLTRMVANACARMRRGRKNDPSLHDAEAVAADPTPDPEDQAAVSELAGHLAAALETLAPMDRTLVILADVEGWKGPDLADRTGLGHAAVRARLSRSRRRLRDALTAVA